MDTFERAAHGRKAVSVGTPDYELNGDDADGKRTDVCDTLANIMHYCAEEKIDFYYALQDAQMHFNAELNGED